MGRVKDNFFQDTIKESMADFDHYESLGVMPVNPPDMGKQGEAKMADYSKMYESESKFLKADDLKGQAIKVVISGAKVEPMTADPNGDHKLVVYFEGKEKGVALNQTNFKTLAGAFGSDSDYWMGKTIELFSMMVDYQGKMVPALRLRVVGEDDGSDIPF